MALFTPGPLAAQISGTLGSAVFHSGKRSGVIAHRGSRVRRESAYQQIHRLRMAQVYHQWADMYDSYRAQWRTEAANFTAPDRLGRPRRLSPIQACASCNLATGNDVLGSVQCVTAQRHPPTETPVVLSSSFTQGGPYNLELQASNYVSLLASVRCTRFLEYGSRQGPNCTQLVYYDVWDSAEKNLYNSFLTAGWTFTTGQIIRLRIRFDRPYLWPSPPAYTTITIA
jgi:hypothetical protein